MSTHTHVLMVIDDDFFIRELLTEILEDDGYAVISCANGREALACLERGALLPDLILLDYVMPHMNGPEFRAEQQRAPQLATIPVILLSASDEQMLSDPVLNDVTMLAKPIDLAGLRHTIAQQLAVC